MSVEGKFAYSNGLLYWNKDQYEKARYWFEQAYIDPNFKDSALSKLIHIDLKEGKFARARRLLKENGGEQKIALKPMYGLLESAENNFEAGKKYYGECMVDPYMQTKALLVLSRLYVQTGDYDIARKMLETLCLNSEFVNDIIFELVYLNIFEKDYQEAVKNLNLIDLNKLSRSSLRNYRMLDTYLKYCMAIRKINMKSNEFEDELLCCLLENDDNLLLAHISKHLNQQERCTNGCFFEDIDLKKLLEQARNAIEPMNPSHFGSSDLYRFRLKQPIGFKEDEVTSDLCVATVLGTKKIITMYPILLSDEFDREQMSFSKELKLKRNGGRNNDEK